MQRQIYMMQKDITCEKTLETYFALVNVPHYGLKPPPNSIIHYSPFLGPLPLVNYYDRVCFWSYKFSPFRIKH
jgi:hypothetical protein